MAISLMGMEGTIIDVVQSHNRPLVYFDNWFYNDIIINDNTRLQTIDLIKRKKATVGVSAINLYEILNRTDKSQILEIAEFLSNFDTMFIKYNPIEVVGNEIKVSMGQTVSPMGEEILVKLLVGKSKRLSNELNVSELILNMNKEVEDLEFTFKEYFAEDYNVFINKFRNNPDFLGKMKRNIKELERKKIDEPYTYELLGKCINYVVANKNMNMPEKEWRDVFHTIVPVAYCDFVLIDDRWVNFVRSTGYEYPTIAKVYSKRMVGDFLRDLELFEK